MEKNPITVDDFEIIKWLQNESNNSPEIRYAWKILNAYYNHCKENLKIQSNKNPFSSYKEMDDTISVVKQALKINSFCKECQEFFGKNKNYYLELINRDNLTIEEKWEIANVCRLYNMRLKLGHSARITYIAYYELSSMLKNTDNENIQLFKSTVILSALLHDIGRFYQASNYNNLVDDDMIKAEGKINNLNVDHAIAGYYYSLATSLELHKISTNDPNEKRKFIMEAVAATVVKFHQKSNAMLSHFDYEGTDDVLYDKDIIDEVYSFITYAYDMSKTMNYHVEDEIDPKHKKFIDDFIKSIKLMLNKKIDYKVADGFEIDTQIVDDIHLELDSKIKEVLSDLNNKNVDDIGNNIIDIIDEILSKENNKLDNEEKKELHKEICNLLEGMLNFDVSESINDLFKSEKSTIQDSVKFLLSNSLNMTMDADKIDIFNQRALGIYNVPYNPNNYSIFPDD